MNIELNELQATVHRGARQAYNLENPFVGDVSFEEWLGSSSAGVGIISRLTELCRCVVEDDGRTSFGDCSTEEQRAILAAYGALQGVSELEQLARLAADSKSSY